MARKIVREFFLFFGEAPEGVAEKSSLAELDYLIDSVGSCELVEGLFEILKKGA